MSNLPGAGINVLHKQTASGNKPQYLRSDQSVNDENGAKQKIPGALQTDYRVLPP